MLVGNQIEIDNYRLLCRTTSKGYMVRSEGAEFSGIEIDK